MPNIKLPKEEKHNLIRKRQATEHGNQVAARRSPEVPLATLQNYLGNRGVQRLLAQRSGDGAFDLDDETTNRINQARGSGQALDSGVQEQMGGALGGDFRGVRVHTSGESDQLNQQLGAKAFTTGQDVFFRSGAYSPQSSGGQELIAHELTHVVQQSSGAVGGGSTMTVNAPGDQFEQEADAVAKTVMSAEVTPPVQRQEVDEEDDLQMKAIPRAAEEDELLLPEDEQVQMQELPEEDEELTG